MRNRCTRLAALFAALAVFAAGGAALAAESASDGPGGDADTVPNANTQQEGEH
jgi:hypothetical protein